MKKSKFNFAEWLNNRTFYCDCHSSFVFMTTETGEISMAKYSDLSNWFSGPTLKDVCLNWDRAHKIKGQTFGKP